MPSTLSRDLKMSPSVIGLAADGVLSSSREPRRHARYPFTGAVEAFEPESQTRIQGRTADLSESGCYVDAMNPLPAETRVRIRITREQRSFESRATVVYSVAGMGMGLQFEATDAQQLVSLRKWISELSGEATEETATEETATEQTATEQKGDSPARVAAENSVLNDLVIELMRKGVLAEAIGSGMLQRLASAT